MAQRATSHPGQTVTIDGKTYRLGDLSEAARADLISLQATDQSIQRAQHRLAMLQTARAVYAKTLAGKLESLGSGQGDGARDALPPSPVTRVFWHNIGLAENRWWRYLVANHQLAVGFDNTPGDAGEALLRRYLPGDVVVAYASGKGALGWARVDASSRYHLAAEGSSEDLAAGDLRHRLSVTWQAVADTIDQAVTAAEIRRDVDIRHPTRPSVAIDLDKGKALVERLTRRFLQP